MTHSGLCGVPPTLSETSTPNSAAEPGFGPEFLAAAWAAGLVVVWPEVQQRLGGCAPPDFALRGGSQRTGPCSGT